MAQIDDLPPLREVIRRHGLSAKKSLGQNFLLDLNLTTRIARAAEPLESVTAVEIGPGPGGLTRGLLALGARRVIAIERDERALEALHEIAARYEGRLDVIAGDALEVDVREALGPERARVVANLPYNIATPLLIGWLTAEPWPPWYDMLVLMFQREVAERICARPGESQYGRLGVLAGWRTDARIAFNIDRNAFVPAPKVTSAVVHLVPKPVEPDVPVNMLEAVTRAAFGQRRKMIRQSLKGLGVPIEPLLAAAGLQGSERAEDLDIPVYVTLTRAFAEAKRG